MDRNTNWSLYGSVLSINCITLIGGASYSWTSPVLPKLNSNATIQENPLGRTITPLEESVITSLLSGGASVGPFIAGFVLDKIGRKKTLMVLSAPITVAYLVMAFATHINLYYFGRFLLGLGVGCIYSVVPVYVGEISEDFNRGAMGCILLVVASTGALCCALIGPFVSIRFFCLLFLVPMVLFLVAVGIFVPESPYYLLMVDEEKEAEMALVRLRTGSVQQELEEIRKNVEKSKQSTFKFTDFTRSKAVFRGVLVSGALMFFQQATGITIIVSYTQSIFEASGSSLGAEISAIIIGVIQVLATLIATKLIDRLGRRILLVTSLVGVCLSLLLLGLYFFLKENYYDHLVDSLFWLPIASLLLYVASYMFGIGPISFSFTGELFAPHVKAAAGTFVTFICLFFSFLLALFFPNFVQFVGMGLTFWIFGLFTSSAVLFVLYYVPETKGRSLYDIQMALEGLDNSKFCNSMVR